MINKNILMAHISKKGKFMAMKTCEFYVYLNTSRKDGSHIWLEQALRNTQLRPAMLLTP
jgi:hypothetical protein